MELAFAETSEFVVLLVDFDDSAVAIVSVVAVDLSDEQLDQRPSVVAVSALALEHRDMV